MLPIIFLVVTAGAVELEWRCPPFWQIDRSSNLCFKVFRDDVSSNSEAEDVCSRNNATLAVITSQETLQTVDEIFRSSWRVPKAKYPADRVWISSESPSVKKTSEVSNNASQCSSFIPSRSPESPQIESIPCDFSFLGDARVQHVLCEANLATKQEVSLYCEEGWSLFNERSICHKLFQVGVSSMDGAETFCHAHAANVSMMLSESEKDFVQDLMTNGWKVKQFPFPLNQVWIGMRRIPPKKIRTFIWNNGMKVENYDMFARHDDEENEPNGVFDIEPCVTTNPLEIDRKGRNGGFSDISCDPWKYYQAMEDIVNHVLCEKPAAPKKNVATTLSITNHMKPCTEDWNVFEEGKNCHKLVEVGVTTLYGAQKICEGEGARLSSLETKKEVKFVMEMMQRGWKIGGSDTFYNHVWVSLERDKDTGKWKWNGKDDMKKELGKVVPNEFGSSNCAAFQPVNFIRKTENFFGEVPCDTAVLEHRYPPSHILCERDNTDRITMRKNNYPDCPKGWHFYENDLMCIRIFVEDTYSYQEAQNKCVSEGGNLLSVGSNEKRTFVTGLTKLGWRPRITDMSKSPMWVGLKKEGPFWKWINGEIFDISRSSSNVLDDIEKENCAVMFPTRLSMRSFKSDFYYVECELSYPVEHLACERDSFLKTNKNSQMIARIAAGVVLFVIFLIFVWVIFSFWYKANQRKFNEKSGERNSVRKRYGSHRPLTMRSRSLSSDSTSEIPRRNVDLIEEIGQGFFGVVWRAKLHHPKEFDRLLDVAVKQVRYSNDTDQCESLATEIKFLSKLGAHPNVIKFIGATTSQNSRHRNMLIMEYCPRGNLRDHLLSIRNNSYVNDDNLINFSLQIASGMEYISSIPCIHRDLAARNVLLTNNYICKITDFGLAKNEDYYRGSPSCGLPYRWMSPEAIESKRFTIKSDVWSFGIVLFEIYSYGSTPYTEFAPQDLISEILSGRINKTPVRTPEKIASLIDLCWEFQPESRPTFTECVSTIKEYLLKTLPEKLTQFLVETGEAAKTQTFFDEWMTS